MKAPESKRILAVVNNVWPPPVQITGISVIYECQKELAKLGNEVHILTSIGIWDKNARGSIGEDLREVRKWHQEEEKRYNIKFHTYNLQSLKAFPRLVFFINRFVPIALIPLLNLKYKFDVIHEYTSTPLLVFRSWLLKVILRSPIVCHTLIAQTPFFFGSFKWLSFFHPAIDTVICSSLDIKRKLISVGYPSKLLYSLPLGVDDKKFIKLPGRNGVRDRYRIPRDSRLFLFLAPIEPHKGPDIFVNSAIKLLKLSRQKNLLFIIATYKSPGKTPYEERKAEILKLTLGYEKYFKIYEGQHNVPSLMAMADFVVVPQTTIDGATSHPVTLLEAMAAKKITISSDICGISEVVKDGCNGFLFENKNIDSLAGKMLYVSKNFDRLTAVRKNAYRAIEDNYKVGEIAKRVNNIYRGKGENGCC